MSNLVPLIQLCDVLLGELKPVILLVVQAREMRYSSIYVPMYADEMHRSVTVDFLTQPHFIDCAGQSLATAQSHLAPLSVASSSKLGALTMQSPSGPVWSNPPEA